MLKSYVDALYNIVEKDKRVLSLVADNGTDYDWLFQRDFPDNFFNVGIAEQNMVAMSAGLSDAGYTPFITTAGAFIIYRAYEFIRDDICLCKRNVKMFASGSGISISNLGPTHHATEDIALLRTLPNLTVLSPSTPLEMKEAVDRAYYTNGPVYIRGEMAGEENIEFFKQISDDVICDIPGDEIIVIAIGSVLSMAKELVNQLKNDGIYAGLYHITKLIPLDEMALCDIMKNAKQLITIEDHQASCGFGNMVLEIINKYKLNVTLSKIGYDGFVVGYGNRDEVRQMNMPSLNDIIKGIKREIGC